MVLVSVVCFNVWEIMGYKAPKGNKFWELRAKHGRDKLFATPELLLEAACEYFNWCIKNPLIEVDFMSSKGGIVKVEKPKMRPFTIIGLAMYCDASSSFWREFKSNCKETNRDFLSVITRIEEVIYNQKFEGAAAGFLNPNIIARDLGLKEHTDITSDNEKLKANTYIFPDGTKLE